VLANKLAIYLKPGLKFNHFGGVFAFKGFNSFFAGSLSLLIYRLHANTTLPFYYKAWHQRLDRRM
jgi:hypothetical protein